MTEAVKSQEEWQYYHILRHTALKCYDLRRLQTSLNCWNQRLFKLFGEKLTLLSKLAFED